MLNIIILIQYLIITPTNSFGYSYLFDQFKKVIKMIILKLKLTKILNFYILIIDMLYPNINDAARWIQTQNLFSGSWVNDKIYEHKV